MFFGVLVMSGLSINTLYEKRCDPLSYEEQCVLFEKAKAGDSDAKDKLIYSVMGLIPAFARRYSNMSIHVSFDDLAQSGCVGLMRAFHTFDPAFKTNFSTHAVYWVRKEMLRTLRLSGKLIQLPERFSDALRRFIEAKSELENALQREASEIELSQYMHLPVDKVKDFIRYSYVYSSLDDPDFFLNHTVPSAESAFHQVILKSDIQKLLLVLDEREREVIRLRYGLEPYTDTALIKEIAKKMHLSDETIRKTEILAIRKMRRYLEATGLDLMNFI